MARPARQCSCIFQAKSRAEAGTPCATVYQWTRLLAGDERKALVRPCAEVGLTAAALAAWVKRFHLNGPHPKRSCVRQEAAVRDRLVKSRLPMPLNGRFGAATRQTIALRRVGQLEDIAAIIACLASDSGRWVTGQRIDASGGQRI